MGRIKTQLIKRISKQLIEQHSSEFSEDFGKNRERVMQYADVPSKKLRNIIAGYTTRLSRMQKKKE